MALATKCPHCNTIFRVAHDQLKLRGGIVRCGACNEVFDGNAALVDPTPKQPVIIDIPASAPTPVTSPELDALISTLDTIHATEAPTGASARGVEPHHGQQAAPSPEQPPEREPVPGPALEHEHETVSEPERELEPAPGHEPEPGPMPELEPTPEPEHEVETVSEPEHELESPPATEPEPLPELTAATAPQPDLQLDLAVRGPEAAAPADEVFDLDLDVESEPEDAPSIGEEPAAAKVPPWEDAAPARGTLPWEDEAAPEALEDALVLDVGQEDDTPRREAVGAHSAWPYAPADADGAGPPRDPGASGDSEAQQAEAETEATHDMDAAFDAAPVVHAYDGRLEPTLDIPDEHLTAVALHDSFELDAYPHLRDEQRDAAEDGVDDGHVVTLSGGTALAAALDGADTDGADLGPDAADDTTAAEPTAPATPLSAHAPEEPGFVKRSRRRERFGKAGRVLMACAIPLLLAGIAAQVVGTFRNPLAAAVPALKPALVSACALAGCKVELPAQIDALSIEQGELQTMADNVFSFATSLRNQSASAQAWPHIELILNDGADKPVLRRVFAPREYLPSPAEVEQGFLPRSEQSVKLYFELAQVKASGYHIAVFYP